MSNNQTTVTLSAAPTEQEIKFLELHYLVPENAKGCKSLARYLGNQLVAVLLYQAVDYGAHITAIAVDPAYRKRAIARVLISHLQGSTSSITLNVLFTDSRNLGIFKNIGFSYSEINPLMGYVQMRWGSNDMS